MWRQCVGVCVKMCAAWPSLHMHTAASGCGTSRCLPQTEDTLYPYDSFKKITCRYQRFLLIVIICLGSRLIIQQCYRRWSFRIGSKFWGRQLHQRTAAPIEAGTVCGFIPRHSASRQSLIIVPFLLPRLSNPPPPSSSSRWLRCLLAPLLPLGLVVMSKAVRQSVTTHTHKKIYLRISHSLHFLPVCHTTGLVAALRYIINVFLGYQKKLCMIASWDFWRPLKVFF